MKKNIHPQWNHDCVVTCSCGASFVTGSTQKTLVVDICSKCHPFFTGEMKFVDRQGRVDKFMKKMQQAQAKQKEIEERRKQKQSKKQKPQDDSTAQSYKQLLSQQKQALKQSSKKNDDSGETTDKKNSPTKKADTK